MLGAPKLLQWHMEETASCLSSCPPQRPVQADRSGEEKTSGESPL